MSSPFLTYLAKYKDDQAKAMATLTGEIISGPIPGKPSLLEKINGGEKPVFGGTENLTPSKQDTNASDIPLDPLEGNEFGITREQADPSNPAGHARVKWQTGSGAFERRVKEYVESGLLDPREADNLPAYELYAKMRKLAGDKVAETIRSRKDIKREDYEMPKDVRVAHALSDMFRAFGGDHSGDSVYQAQMRGQAELDQDYQDMLDANTAEIQADMAAEESLIKSMESSFQLLAREDGVSMFNAANLQQILMADLSRIAGMDEMNIKREWFLEDQRKGNMLSLFQQGADGDIPPQILKHLASDPEFLEMTGLNPRIMEIFQAHADGIYDDKEASRQFQMEMMDMEEKLQRIGLEVAQKHQMNMADLEYKGAMYDVLMAEIHYEILKATGMDEAKLNLDAIRANIAASRRVGRSGGGGSGIGDALYGLLGQLSKDFGTQSTFNITQGAEQGLPYLFQHGQNQRGFSNDMLGLAVQYILSGGEIDIGNAVQESYSRNFSGSNYAPTGGYGGIGGFGFIPPGGYGAMGSPGMFGNSGYYIAP